MPDYQNKTKAPLLTQSELGSNFSGKTAPRNQSFISSFAKTSATNPSIAMQRSSSSKPKKGALKGAMKKTSS